jgi:hypothetical protein
MKAASVLVAAIIAAAVPGASAQQTAENLPPRYPGTSTHVPGVFIPPIAGEPFTASVEVQTEVVATDGTWSTRHTINQIARDSAGRIRNERRALVPETFRGDPRILEVHLFDPQTKMSVFYDPMAHVATERVLPNAPFDRNPARPGATVEDLGVQTLNGIQTKGLRYSVAVPAQTSGTGQPVEITDEYWYSEELHLNILMRHHDPRTGLQTVAITSIDRNEPTASLFEIPAGYKVVDVTPPEGAPLSPSGGASALTPSR